METIMSNIEQTLLALLTEALVRERELAPELDLDTDFVSGLGLESIQVMEFVMTVEERFDIAIDLDTLSTVKSIRDLGAVVAKAKAVTP